MKRIFIKNCKLINRRTFSIFKNVHRPLLFNKNTLFSFSSCNDCEQSSLIGCRCSNYDRINKNNYSFNNEEKKDSRIMVPIVIISIGLITFNPLIVIIGGFILLIY